MLTPIAINFIKKKGIDFPKLVIAGPGADTKYGQKILKLIAGNTILRENTFFTMMLQGAAKWGALYGAELFVLPTHQENFGIAIVEAMACKLPVLITNKVNIWKDIANTNSGIVEDDTLIGIIKGFDKWMALNRDEKILMREAAYTTYENQYTASTTCKKFVEILQHQSDNYKPQTLVKEKSIPFQDALL